MGLNSFLPLCKMKRQWSDRVKLVEIPLFNSYVFVNTTLDQVPKLLGINGVSRFLSFGGEFATISEEEIEIIKKVVESKQQVNVRPYTPKASTSNDKEAQF